MIIMIKQKTLQHFSAHIKQALNNRGILKIYLYKKTIYNMMKQLHSWGMFCLNVVECLLFYDWKKLFNFYIYIKNYLLLYHTSNILSTKTSILSFSQWRSRVLGQARTGITHTTNYSLECLTSYGKRILIWQLVKNKNSSCVHHRQCVLERRKRLLLISPRYVL